MLNLKRRKGKEDGKLIDDMNVRTASVVRAPGEGIRLIKEMGEIVAGGSAGAGEVRDLGNTGETGDIGHAERMKMALEKAKMRNKSLDGGAP